MPIMFGRTFLNDPQRSAERREMVARISANDRVGISRATRGVIDREGVYEHLGSIRVPTLIIVGDEDTGTRPEKARRMNAAIPGSRLVEIPRAGHTSTLEQPDAVTGALTRFLEKLGGGGAS